MKKLIPILILLAACSKEHVPMARSVATDAAARGDAARAASPRIVRSAEMRIVVADTSKAVDAVTKSIEAKGGYVSGSRVWRDGESLRAHLTLRVPAADLTAALAAIRVLARRVESETIASQDVTQEYVDLESQLRNLEATENELRELLTVARVRSRKAADVLEVHQQLTNIRGQIEQTRGRMRHLSQVTAMSSIELDVVPDALAPGWQPLLVARDATRALVVLLQRIGTGLIWFLIYGIPVFGMLALLVALLARLARRARAA